MRPDFEKAAAAATALLLQQRLYSLRLEVTRLSYDREIVFDSMQRFCSMTRATLAQITDGTDCLRDGCTIIRRHGGKNVYVVLYNLEVPLRERRSFTLAHEIGHIYLEHEEDDDRREQEANCFAAQLLAPAVLVDALARQSKGPVTPADICAVFALSRQAAGNRIAELARRPDRRFSMAELQLLERYRHLLPCPEQREITL